MEEENNIIAMQECQQFPAEQQSQRIFFTKSVRLN